MMRQQIDINCDMAEGMGNEAELMPWISSANIACGYHAGNEDLMKETIDLCLEHDVAIGAHPSFYDRENFGRTNMILKSGQIITLVTDQLQLLKKIADQRGAKLHHIKPHGALYNMAAKDAILASSIAQAVKYFDSSLIFYGLSQSVMIHEAEKLKLKIANEVFADRTYLQDGSLTPRSQPHALIENEDDALTQVIRFVSEGRVKAFGGKNIEVKADTICLHGDGKRAVAFAKLIHERLTSEKICIQTVY